MYISINKEWLNTNMQKFLDASDDKECLMIDTEGKAELNELSNDGELFIAEDTSNQIYCSLDYTPNTDTIVSLVENSIDDIKGDSLVSIIELVVKKLNKFKSLIESIRGL